MIKEGFLSIIKNYFFRISHIDINTMKAEQKKLPNSQVEIEFELTEEEFSHFVEHALEHLKSHVKMDGFRQGQVPVKLAKERIGKENLLMEAGDIAVRETYSKYIFENKIEPLGQPDVSIIKMGEGNPFIFKAKITVLPEINLPDYKEIASKIKAEDFSVSEEEVQDALKYLQKSRAKMTEKTEPAQKKDFVQIEYSNKDINAGKPVDDQFILGDGGFMKGFEENIEGMKTGEEKEFKATFPDKTAKKDLAGKEGDFKVKIKGVHKMEMPEISDEFAKQLGVFEGLEALKTSIKDGLTAEKTEEQKQKKRAKILDKISEKANFEMPSAIVDYEKDRLFEELKQKITQGLKITFEEYLASVKKTEQEIKDTYQKEAEKRIKNFLVLRELGKQENVLVSDEEVLEEVTKSVKSYSKEDLAKVDIEQLKEYAKGVLFNEKVFQKLENYSAK